MMYISFYHFQVYLNFIGLMKSSVTCRWIPLGDTHSKFHTCRKKYCNNDKVVLLYFAFLPLLYFLYCCLWYLFPGDRTSEMRLLFCCTAVDHVTLIGGTFSFQIGQISISNWSSFVYDLHLIKREIQMPLRISHNL